MPLGSVCRHKLRVRASLGHATPIQNDNAAGTSDGAKTVGKTSYHAHKSLSGIDSLTDYMASNMQVLSTLKGNSAIKAL